METQHDWGTPPDPHPDADRVRVVVLGTDHRSGAGGVANALVGFLEALKRQDLLHGFVEIHHWRNFHGKWRPAVTAVPQMLAQIREVQAAGYHPVVYAHGSESLSMLRNSSLLHIARQAGAATLLQLHAPNIETWLGRRRSRWPFLVSLQSADQICALTPYWRKQLLDVWPDLKVKLVPDPLPPYAEQEAQRPLPEQRHSEDELRVLTMTRLIKGKGPEHVVAAMPHLPAHVRCTVAGDGDYRETLEQMARDLGVADRVHFAGWVAGEEKLKLLSNHDVFCLPSTLDSFGMGFVEAMSFGLPVVAVRWGPIPEVVPHEVAGVLVPAAEGKSVASGIAQLYDPARRRKLGAGGKAWVLEQFAIDAVGRRLRAALPL